MSVANPVVALHSAHRDDIADLVTRRPLPGPRLANLGAFLFLNHHGPQTYPRHNSGLPFGPHPHRGFETVSFILQGEMAHRDSAGHESVITTGGVQWMTAGSGLVHAEISPDNFKRDGGPLEILQLWVNLPARLKMTSPHYIGLQKEQIPEIVLEKAVVHLIAGAWRGILGPVQSLTGVFMSQIDLKAGARVTFSQLEGRDIFFYVTRGDLAVNGVDVRGFQLVEFGPGGMIDIEAITDGFVVFGHASPIHEPIVAHGPFVMNTPEEIRQAYADYQAGRFGHPK